MVTGDVLRPLVMLSFTRQFCGWREGRGVNVARGGDVEAGKVSRVSGNSQSAAKGLGDLAYCGEPWIPLAGQ